MESREAASGRITGTGAQTASETGGVETPAEKRVVKLTVKALADKLEKLQDSRRAKLNKVTNIRKSMQSLMLMGDKEQVQNALEELINVCNEAKCVHESLLGLLPCDEKEKHVTWFNAKMLAPNECIAEAKRWVSCIEGDTHEKGNIEDDIHPDDSVSNVGSKHSSHKSMNSGKSSTTSSARIKVEADRAALMARVASLKERQALEEQEQQLKRKREQLDLEAELAASTAKLAVLRAYDVGSSSQVPSNGMNSYLERDKRKMESANVLNPSAKEYKPGSWKSSQQNDMTKGSLLSNRPLDMRPNEHQQENNLLGTSQHLQYQPTTAQLKPEERQPTYQHLVGQHPTVDILTIMHRQNEITAALVQQQRSLSLPPRDIPLFEGDALQYRTFIKAFEQGVEEKAGQADCLYYLEQFIRGQPQELVRSCQHMAPERGYAVAKGLLQEHFGNQYKIATAYIEKALAWQIIKSEDVKALQAYSLFLRGCCNVMGELQYMEELDMPVNMRAIISKLPYKMREQWRTVAHDIMEKSNNRAYFIDLVKFMERHVRILSDPLFGNIQEPTSAVTGTKPLARFKPQSGYKVKENIVATTVTSKDLPQEAKEPTSDPAKAENAECLCCACSHSLDECKQFKGKMHKDKIHFLREKGVCFACLGDGHMSRDCERHMTCKVCGQTHPTVLHIKRQVTAWQQEPSQQPYSFQTCGHTGAGEDRCVLSILPVKVKSAKGNHIIETYAFLDPGSSATFCSEHLMQRLNVTGRRTSFLLHTMGQETVVPAYSLTGLEVSDLDGNDFYILPEVFTQKKMPVTTDSMVTHEDLAKWPYLSKVHIPSIKANVDLLIGTNAPKILEPWEVINSCGNGPYAIRTVLGWVVNGPLIGNSGTLEAGLPSANVNRISVCKLEEMLTKQYNHDFNERSEEEKERSREDLKFLETVEHSAVLQDGKYCLKLPLKSKEVYLPNNFVVAKQSIQGLRKRFLNNKHLHQEYAGYMNALISKTYAEPVPQHQLHQENGPTDQLIGYFFDWRGLKTSVAWFLRLKVGLLGRIRLRKQLEASEANHSEETSQDRPKPP
ncbi:uncharacterized protein LOC119485230 [Sebastes umbrosus]|uniref:uncharacterized protein LOC119485230 n=1 Tax=Sebastes umbrosus TaxID=72105 RepID=UPI00189D3834|nr:uncharacterized protein LOC119485230 [Sebastes umbrosus]